MKPTSAPGTYLGQSQTGSKQQIPVFTSGPQAGQVDINALIGQMVDRRKIYFYDTYKLGPGGVAPNQTISFFQNGLGQPDPNNGNIVKTLCETNMQGQGGQFSPPYDCIIFNLGFFFWWDNRLYDITQICKQSWFEFKILEKRMWWGQLQRHPAGMGLSGYTTQPGESVWTNGTSVPEQVWYFGDYKKYIPPLVHFELNLNFPETLNQYYNSSLPANVAAVGTSGNSLPTLLSQGAGGNGIQLVAVINGLSDAPVQ